jgi:hypothetical protein
MKYAKILLTLFLALHISCKESPSENEKIVGNGQLNINGSIDSVKIGDLPERVIELLGEPTSWIDGDFDGFGYGYDFGQVTFWKIPVDTIYTATFIHINSNYEGETIDGIGMGSTRTDVLKYIRPPDKMSPVDGDSSLSFVDSYIIDKNENYFGTRFLFFYDGNEMLYRIEMSYYQ